MVTQYAAHKAGLLVVCVNPAYRAAELEYTLQKMQCKVLVAGESFKNQSYYDILCELIPEIPNCKSGNIQSQKFKDLKHIIKISDKSFSGTYSFKDIKKNDGTDNKKLLNERMKTVQMDDPGCILFTSGTTGLPKGAVLTHFQMLNQGIISCKLLGFFEKKPIICVQVPLFHIFGLSGGTLLTLLCNGTAVYPSGHFHAPSSLKSIEEERCTMVYGTPTMFVDMLVHISKGNYDLSSWKEVTIGAAPVHENLINALRDKCRVKIYNVYGSTEITGMVSMDNKMKFPSAGRLFEYTEIKIVDTDGRIVPINTKGEILCRSPFVCSGYWDEKEKTAETFDNARWYHTGDVGVLDENGCIIITGRIKDMVIRGGENIYPQEIENFLLSHPAISEIYVVGVPDSRLGEELCACIQLKQGHKLSEKDVKEFCKEKISYFKIPRYVLFFEDYPKTESGKIQKYILQKKCINILNL
ncbi:medium-chain acyl-CoA ligase ACSF2, mitochondrial-like isoform X2 [Centruroides vittatus]